MVDVSGRSPLPSPKMNWFKKSNETTAASQRKSERISWSPESQLRVELSVREDSSVPVQWVDLSVTGVKLLVPSEVGAGMRTGRPVRLEFFDGRYEFFATGSVVWSRPSPDGDGQHIGVQFAYIPPEVGEDRPALWEYFNRRVAFRIQPPPAEPLDVHISGKEGVLKSRLFDISATGMNILIDADGARQPWVATGLGEKYRLTLRLPTMNDRIVLVARAERSGRQGRFLMWSMDFLEEDEKESGETLLRVSEYVTRRQQEIRAELERDDDD